MKDNGQPRPLVQALFALLLFSVTGTVLFFYLYLQQTYPNLPSPARALLNVSLPDRQLPGLAWIISPTPTPTQTLTPTKTPTRNRTPTRTRTRTGTPTPAAPTETSPPAATSTPIPPESAFIDGVVGFAQQYALSCEARSATDLAAYFGIKIDELEFQNRLPKSDDPEEGFVGDYRGQPALPPGNYGVHAPPVAALLRKYGLNTYPTKHLAWDTLRNEIAAGRPVMVWVVNSTVNGAPVSYTASNGNQTTVVFLEHTVLVIGYDAGSVSIVDGGMRYTRTVDQFLKSWGVLENSAVLVGDPQMIDQ